MRKLYFISMVFGGMLLTSSCSKSSQSEAMATPSAAASTVVNATVSSGGTYQLILDKWQNASISKQAVNSKISTVELDVKSGSYIYRYSPAEKFIGADQVVLSTKTAVSYSSSGGGGCNHGDNHGDGQNNGASGSMSYDYTYMTIKINVTQ
jgi:hypothetical protein